MMGMEFLYGIGDVGMLGSFGMDFLSITLVFCVAEL